MPIEPLFPLLPPMTNEEAARAEKQNPLHHKRASSHRTITELVVLLAVTIAGLIAYHRATQLPFDASCWKVAGTYQKGIYQDLSIRKPMSDDLLRNRKLIGLRRSQVVALLGKPDAEGFDFRYKVGYSSFAGDPIVLIIKFDDHNQVLECSMQEFG